MAYPFPLRREVWLELSALAAGVILLVIIFFLAGCADPERVRSEREATIDARTCGDKINREIAAYVGPRSAFCSSVQRKVDELVRTDRACLDIYLRGGPPELCGEGGVP